MDAYTISLAISLIRIVVPFSLFRWPLLGGLFCVVADASDVMLMEKFGWGYYGNNMYHVFDKIFDIWYLFFEFLVIHKWTDALARRTGKTLFLWRFAGFAAFEFWAFRPAFFLAPNIFENFYLAYLIIKKFYKDFILTPGKLATLLLVVGIPKMAQEYVMHYKYPDQTWNFLRDHLFWWAYRVK